MTEDIFSSDNYSHLTSRREFRRLYEAVGRVEANKEVVWRECWMYYFRPKPGSDILELGAHNGPNLFHYAQQGCNVDGVEISKSLIKTFYKHLDKESEEIKSRIRMFNGWIEEFRPDKKYDYVIVAEVLEHVVDPVVVLKKAFECVKDDGEVYITAPEKHWGNRTHVRGVSKKDLEEWLKAAWLDPVMLKVEFERTFCIAKVMPLCKCDD